MSCEDFLDETPDNRTEVDTAEKVRKILVSAYPSTTYGMVAELSSDNVDDIGADNPYSDRFTEQVVFWEDVTETDNDSPTYVWEGCYSAIANANQALEGIEALNDDSLSAEKGEALIARAYAHFVLVNMFSKHYNTQSSNTDLGVPYLETAETTLNPQYDRGSVSEVYEKINKDIETALPLIRDDIYDVPKYHFNVKAAYAFAARFNLYYENWEKAKEYATKVLTANPSSLLRDWEAQSLVVRSQLPASTAFYEDTSNLLTQAYSSASGVHFGAYYTGSRFNHTSQLSDRESLGVALPWASNAGLYPYYRAFVYNAANLNKTLFMKMPYLFEYTDAVAGIGFSKTIKSPFTYDETLMVRAEANVMLKDYNAALEDLNTFGGNYYNYGGGITTIDQINTFYTGVAYSTEDDATQKKVLSPKFTVEAGTQENMLHYTLQLRRILTMHDGLRWFDNKRYGMVVPRYQYTDSEPIVVDVLTADDPRKAIQLPLDVISAGLTPNPR
ncbi:RagB/SusD family nutrient uptake outer membrane protein [Polaribacter sejongensis]|uniref:RagB/SusD family nutrient uptake outer membrane protein n=1 Tax=Polaribacter sejongensis TaxID=985043 RepID=UPI0035A70B20